MGSRRFFWRYSAAYYLAMLAAKQNNIEIMQKFLQKGVDKRHIPSLLQMGLYYSKSKNSSDKALKCFREGARQNSLECAFQAGLILELNGEYKDALVYFTKAAQGGEPLYQKHLENLQVKVTQQKKHKKNL